MNEVYIVTVIKEMQDEYPEAQHSAYLHIDDALRAYSALVDEARAESEDYELVNELDEICTETYRYYRIEDLYRADAITITVEAVEVIGDASEDIEL